ncbi:MAG TPA: hypothetical protein VGL66_19325 [Caulobacteraceae bacterium]
MADGLWAVLGAVVGVAGSITTTVLNTWLGKPKPDPVAEARKKLLKQMLNDQRWKWRGLAILSHVVGADETTTKGLLLEIGARGSANGEDLWALTTRVDGDELPDKGSSAP